ncbi:MAG: hypothetical protein IID40_03760 [Planctomycetes bacterium]|nr:hypothetical protein [Planctomycetota bacterium]
MLPDASCHRPPVHPTEFVAPRLFTGVMIFEVVYFFGIAFFGIALLWMTPGIGRSVAAASGISSGGLMFQFLPLFPLWGPLLARWAKGSIEGNPPDREGLYFASEQINRPNDWGWAAVNFVVVFALTSVLINMVWYKVTGNSFPPAFVGLGVPILLSIANALASVKGRRGRRRKRIGQQHAARLRAGLCPRCEYNLKGLTEARCPECGVGSPSSVLVDLLANDETTRSEPGRQS